MLNDKTDSILNQGKRLGWVLEPDAKELMAHHGLDIPAFILTDAIQRAQEFLKSVQTPVVAKAVSKRIIHKTEFNAVVTHISDPDQLAAQMERLLELDGCRQVLVEEMIHGIEVMIGAKNDYQFGPVIVFGIGGTSVEIYNDTAIRMAPLKASDVGSMVQSLKGKEILTGFRGAAGINMAALTDSMVKFSDLIMTLGDQFDSVDLNPVICTPDRCVVADARIIL